jgi:acyl-coenzyme A synthetase/AMP-(fatty) acid ligase
VYAIKLIRPASLPKTTSGKIQRSVARLLWQEGGLDALD